MGLCVYGVYQTGGAAAGPLMKFAKWTLIMSGILSGASAGYNAYCAYESFDVASELNSLMVVIDELQEE